MISIKNSGFFTKTRTYLHKLQGREYLNDLNRYGMLGVNALRAATPVETGLTARSWGYRIVNQTNRPSLQWYNTNKENGTEVAILIQYGHGTGTGGYVQGIDYINPAMRPVFEQIAQEVWKKVMTP